MYISLAFFLIYFVLMGAITVFHCFYHNVKRGVITDNTRIWVSSFECGFMGHRFISNNFSITYFVMLVFFVLFDLEVSLLLNLPFQGSFYHNFVGYSMFISVLALGYCVEVVKGYVTWSF